MTKRTVDMESIGAALYLQERYAAYSASLQIGSDLDQKLATILQLGGMTAAMQGLVMTQDPGCSPRLEWALVVSLVLLAGMTYRAAWAWRPKPVAISGTPDWEKAREMFITGPASEYEALKQAISSVVEARNQVVTENSKKAQTAKMCIDLFGLQLAVLILALLWMLLANG